jgi:WD40 repeat protein
VRVLCPTTRVEGRQDIGYSIGRSSMLAISCNRLRVAVVREATHKPIATFDTTGFVVSSLAFTPDGLKLAAGMRDGSVWIWDIEANIKIMELKHHLLVYSVQFSQDGSKLMTCAGKGTIRMWDMSATEVPLVCFETSRPSAVWVTAYLCVNDEQVLSFGCSLSQAEYGNLTLYDTRSGSKLADLLDDLYATLRCIAVNTSEDVLAIGTKSGSVIVMNLKERIVVRVLDAVFPKSVKLVGLDRHAQLCICCDVNGDMCAVNLISNSRSLWPSGDSTWIQLVVSADGSQFGLKSWRGDINPAFFIHDSQSDSYVSQVVPNYEYCGEICYWSSPSVILM